MLEALKSLFQVPEACITLAWCGKTCSAYTRVHAKTTVLTAILRGRLIRESPYTRVYTVIINMEVRVTRDLCVLCQSDINFQIQGLCISFYFKCKFSSV